MIQKQGSLINCNFGVKLSSINLPTSFTSAHNLNMTLNMDNSEVRCFGVKASFTGEDKSTKRHVGDLSSTNSIHVIEDTSEMKNIEISIFLERMFSTFNRLMKKIELSVSLPILHTHPLLRQILTKEEMNEISETFFEFSTEESCHTSENENLQSSSKVSKDLSGISVSPICHEKINRVLEILNSYSRIRKIVEQEKNCIPDQFKLFLQHMEFIKEHVLRKIQITPEEERKKEVYYRKIWHANEKAHIDIKDLAVLIDTQNLNFKKVLDGVIRQYEEKKDIIKKVEQKFKEDIKYCVLKSEGMQLKANNISVANRINLNQNLMEAKNNLESLYQKNILAGKNITSQRYKVEAQLADVISKYDTDIGEEQKKFDELVAEYNSIDSEKLDLEESMEIQLKICNAFIKEREEVVLNIFREKLEKFMRLRATKVIQRWWRKIYWRYRTKPKKIKGDKKKKKKKIKK